MAYIASKLGPPKGFHPCSSTTIYLPNPHSFYRSCTLHLYFSLPSLVFVDTHELAQRNSSYTFIHWGSKDLEKPVHALPNEISELLLDVRLEGAGKAKTAKNEEGGITVIQIEVPMHLRYGRPRSPGDTVLENEEETGPYEKVHVDWPKAFLRCPPTLHTMNQDQVSVSLPRHVLSVLPKSEEDAALIAISPHADLVTETSSTVYVPLGDQGDLVIVESLTALTMILCFVFLLRSSWRTASRLARKTGRAKTA